MKNRLSNSSINKWNFCPTAYKHHYINKYRPIEIGSALIFGGAVDKAIEYILSPSANKVENIANEYEVFDYHWRNAYINDVLTNVKECKNILYSKYDIDEDLLTDEEMEDTLNGKSWSSLRHKGHLMLDAFKRDILPKITKIHATQQEVTLQSDNSDDSVIGYLDAVLSIEGYDKPIVMDWKTSARPYNDDSVIYSSQLAQYLHTVSDEYDNTRLAGYCVFIKNIEKNRVKICSTCGYDGSGSKHKTCSNEKLDLGGRCNGAWKETIRPVCRTQLIIDEIPLAVENLVIDNISAINDAIKAKVYTKNLKGCLDDGYGRKCQYFNICYNNDITGFIQKEENNPVQTN